MAKSSHFFVFVKSAAFFVKTAFCFDVKDCIQVIIV